jgi:hypothetical protein
VTRGSWLTTGSTSADLPLGALLSGRSPIAGRQQPHQLVRAPLPVARATPTRWCCLPCSGSGWPHAAGQPLDVRVYSGLGHLSLVATNSPLTQALIAWAQARLAGNPAHNTC